MANDKEDAVAGASPGAVLAELKAGKTVSCYLLYGEEEFQLHDLLDRMVDALLPDAGDRDFNLFATDGDHEEIGFLCESLLTPPLLPGRKVLVVRNTRLFESKNNLPQLIVRIRERSESDPGKAVADFMQFLALTDLQLEDLREEGWRKIDEESWQQLVPGDDAAQREGWLPRIVEIADSRKAVPVVKKSDDTERLERILTGGMPEGNHLILTAPGVDKRKKLFRTVSSVGRVLIFEKIKKEQKQRQAVMELAAPLLAKSGKRITPAAWEAIGRKTGFSLRESLGAIDKLISYSGDNAVIEADDVEAVVGRSKEDVVFALTGALAARNLKDSLVSLRELLDQGDAPLMIFAMLVREIRFLLQARLLIDAGRIQASNANMSEYGRFQKSIYPSLKRAAGEAPLEIASQHPFAVYQYLKNAGRFTRQELAGFLEMLARIDLELKSTQLPPPLLLENFLVAVCRKGVKAS